MPNTLFLRLEGPLQAWGERGRWAERDTTPEPTKSGVVGLLGCALGWQADDDLYRLSQQIQLGVRCDQPGTRLVDYHTIVGGVLSAEGKIKRNATTKESETVVSWRHYLGDASFLVAVQSTSESIERLAEAVQNPHWPVYLGRKACIPTCPIFEGVADFPTLEAALTGWPWYRLDIQEETTLQRRGVIEDSSGYGTRRRDALLSRSHRTFGPRYTQDILVTVIVKPKEF